jgi:hypothetical protein
MTSPSPTRSWLAEKPLVLVLAAGLVLRLALVPYLSWTDGDPLFSYSYRALLISHGEWAGVFKMWHPPGFPLLLALLHVLTGYQVPPYSCGIVLNLGCYVALAWVVDRMIRSRVGLGVRALVACCLAFWEGLFYWQVIPVTEPLYAVLLYGAVALLADEARPRFKSVLWAGILLGLAATLRREGIVSALALGALVIWDSRKSAPGRAAALFAGAFFLFFGWTLFDPHLVEHLRAQEFSYTVPAVNGLAANFSRAVESLYHASVEWLPQVLLLPFWAFVFGGLFNHWADERWKKLNLALAAGTLPALAAVILTIQHKRTGFFLLPGAAVYFGLGAQVLLRPFETRFARFRKAAFASLVLMVALQAGRILWHLRKHPARPTERITYLQAKLLGDRKAKVWAFGNEPEIYAYAGLAIDYPFDERESYAELYRAQAGDPGAFVSRLKKEGIGLLSFTLSDDASSEGAVQRPYGIVMPRRSDLERVVKEAGSLGLRLVGTERSGEPAATVYLWELL